MVYIKYAQYTFFAKLLREYAAPPANLESALLDEVQYLCAYQWQQRNK